MHPDVGERLTGRAFALCDLILVVREDEVGSAAVDIQGVADVVAAHCRALDMPAGSALAERGIPVRLTGLGSLPDCEVHRVALLVADLDARACLEVLKRHVGQLAILRELGGFEVNVAVDFVGVALFDEGLYDVDDDIHVLGDLGVNVRAADVEPVSVGEVFPDSVLGNLVSSLAELVRLLDYLVVNVGEVLNVEHLVSAELKVSAERVENAQRTGVADVDKVVDGRSACVDFYSAGSDGLQLLFLAGHGVVDLHIIFPPESFYS